MKAKDDIDLPKLDAKIDVIAQECIDIILARTAEGKDVTGAKFKPYSKITVAKKGTKDVTLKDTGKLLNSLDYQKKTDTSFTISFNGVSYAKKVMETRPILGFTEDEMKTITSLVSDQIMTGAKK